MKKLSTIVLPCLLLVLCLASTAPAQNRVLIGISRNGGLVFQTLIHRGRGNIHSEMLADGAGSRTESHARFDDGNDSTVPAPAPKPAAQVERPVKVAAAEEVSSEAANATSQNGPDGGHLICIQQPDGSWRACGLTAELSKAQHTAQVLQQAKIQARVFQFLPLPADVQKLPLLPNEPAVGVAVKLTGEVYGVTKDGRLIEILIPSHSDSE